MRFSNGHNRLKLFIMLHEIFDNTLSVRELARTTKLDATKGNETQLYNVGQIVSGNGLGFKEGIIIDCYNNNGYIYYIVEYKIKPRARKTYTKTLRQTDITLI